MRSTACDSLLDAALRYADLGYPVFPCVPGGKNPLTPHGHRDATTDFDQIERWWTTHPRANLGIATQGMLVVDIDSEANTWPGGPDRLLDLSTGPVSLTPRGGSHRLFRQPRGKAWRCTQSRLAPKVDTRADGGYIVAAPSRVGDGVYRWAPGMELDCPLERLPEPPAWLVEELDSLAQGKSAPGSRTNRSSSAASGDSNAIPSGQRNATLARLGGSMRRVGMSRSEIAAALLRANRDRCVPPLADAEVERIAESIAKYDPDQIAVAFAENHYEQMYAESPDEDDGGHADPGPIPDELLHVPGFIDAVMRHTLETAPYPEPVLAFAGALSLQALLAGRKVRDAMDNRTNLYLVGLANSGVGKDHARKVNARILHEAGLADCLGNSFASGEGIEDRLFAQPASLFQVDEIDGLLLRVGQAKDARHEQIVAILLQMYSSASTVYVMRAKANQERSVIDQPCLCVFGTAVPKHFYEALSARLMTNGFLARQIILECRKRGVGRDETEKPIPKWVVETACWWAAFKPGGSAGNLSGLRQQTYRVPHTEAAGDVFRDLRERADAEYARCELANDPAGMAIWARAYEKTRRLALLYACSADVGQLVVTDEAAVWAGMFVEHQTRRMLFMARHHASENEFDGKRKRLLGALEQWRREHGDQWMPFWRINRKLPWSNRDHEELRDTLLLQRLIECQTTTSARGGRPGLSYRLAPQVASVENPP